ncbi:MULTISPECIES: cytochrome P450 [Mycobacterium]|uniref:Cytochrome P450 n=1 Tax=Mycobacterium colombiense TaxID=339268 RepID=A0A1A0V804_9MYCO|nr:MULTISPECIES: cytochrome P450 [Mycobacterium]OBB79385.1 hypothetical protein A5760_20880 [Mycobacterium colombiense]OBB96756.1 hypothetical protein A5782_01110 [Mycobacterium sp. 852002-40037_SCH5390672]
MGIVAPIVEARRAEPHHDLVSMLVTEEYADDDGSRHRLSDGEVQLFSLLLLAAGSGTTWKQSFITMLTLLQRPDWLARLTADPMLVRGFVGETVRWMPIDPAFARLATRETELGGVTIPRARSSMHASPPPTETRCAGQAG